MALAWLHAHTKAEKPKQLLPKDILVHAKMFSREEADGQIKAALATYSHSNRTNQWMNATVGASTTPLGWSQSTVMWSFNNATSTAWTR